MIFRTMTHIQSREQKSRKDSVERPQPEGLPSISIAMDAMTAHAQRQPERLQSNTTKLHATWTVTGSPSGCGCSTQSRWNGICITNILSRSQLIIFWCHFHLFYVQNTTFAMTLPFPILGRCLVSFRPHPFVIPN